MSFHEICILTVCVRDISVSVCRVRMLFCILSSTIVLKQRGCVDLNSLFGFDIGKKGRVLFIG